MPKDCPVRMTQTLSEVLGPGINLRRMEFQRRRQETKFQTAVADAKGLSRDNDTDFKRSPGKNVHCMEYKDGVKRQNFKLLL
jgi:hypothetical protein